MYFRDTIVSQATPRGYSGVAILRISGDIALNIANKISKSKRPFSHMLSSLRPIFDKKGKKIDEGIYTFFEGPRSYTGENVVEISCHGNPLICKKIINASVEHGAREAEPGEYTKRAFLNGKLSLSQAESVALLISSRSSRGLNLNINNLGGENTKRIISAKKSLLRSLSILEYEFDVSEDEKTLKNSTKTVLKLLKKLSLTVTDMSSSYSIGSACANGIKMVIVGEPNVGKSTLMNQLYKENKSIVDPTPGTTRDLVSAEINLFGFPITITDTAGIRETKNEIEKEGIRRAKNEIEAADVVLSLFTAESKPVDNIDLSKQILIYNKKDLKKNTTKHLDAVSISALKNNGTDLLLEKIKTLIITKYKHSGDAVINTERQARSINQCLACIQEAISLLSEKNPHLELVAHEIKDAVSFLDIFLGKTTSDDILDSVFSNFCVGK